MSDPTSKRTQGFDIDMNKVVGRGIGVGNAAVKNWDKARVVLFKDGEKTYRIITSYPINKIEH